MNRWEEVIDRHSIKHNNKIKKVTKPLRDHFGIEYFSHHQINSRGNYVCLADRIDYAENYVQNKIYLTEAYHGLPALFQPGVSYWQLPDEWENGFDVRVGVMLIEKKEDTAHFYGFCARSKSAIKTLAFNHPKILSSFASHFCHELRHELEEMRYAEFDIFTLSANPDQPQHAHIDKSTLYAYYKDLGLSAEVSISKKISKRERECLLLLLDAKSAKETASILGIGYRTVESYFENIKVKFNCWTKQELFTQAKLLKDLGLL